MGSKDTINAEFGSELSLKVTSSNLEKDTNPEGIMVNLEGTIQGRYKNKALLLAGRLTTFELPWIPRLQIQDVQVVMTVSAPSFPNLN